MHLRKSTDCPYMRSEANLISYPNTEIPLLLNSKRLDMGRRESPQVPTNCLSAVRASVTTGSRQRENLSLLAKGASDVKFLIIENFKYVQKKKNPPYRHHSASTIYFIVSSVFLCTPLFISSLNKSKTAYDFLSVFQCESQKKRTQKLITRKLF